MTQHKIYSATAWNLAGNIIPLVVGVYAIPRLISGMGETRFGVLTIVWAVVGYFGIFDLGLGRGITQAVAEALGLRRETEVPEIFWTGTIVLVGIGGMGTVAFLLFGPPLVFRFLSTIGEMRGEVLEALRWIAVSIPLITIASATRGLLEARSRFGLLNAIRTPYGILIFLLPLIFPSSLRDLGALTGQLVVVRGLTAATQFVACGFVIGPDRWVRPTVRVAKRLLRFGGWMTLTNVLSPLMANFDRFVIGALASVSVVAYYTTPYEIVMRVLVLPAALATTLFPVFGRSLLEDTAVSKRLYRSARGTLGVALFGACYLVSAIGYEMMSAWVGDEFARHARVVLILLDIGVLFNGLAYLPYTVLLGAGRSRAIALTHLLEFAVYMPVLGVLVSTMGIVGAAAAWALRALADLLFLDWQAARYMQSCWGYRRVIGPLGLSAILGATYQVPSLWVRSLLAAVVLGSGALLMIRAGLGRGRADLSLS